MNEVMWNVGRGKELRIKCGYDDFLSYVFFL